MLSFLGLSQQTGNKKIGDLREDKNIGEQLHELKGKMEKTMDKSNREIKNYRELTKFNEQLAKSYSANLKVIVEISRLLGAYNEFFDGFKQKLTEIDQELDIPINGDDFEYMKNLTNGQMVQLEDVFKRETANLKRLYSKFGKQKEYDDVEMAEKLFDNTKTNASKLYENVKEPQANVGGSVKRKRKVNKAPKK
jgi:uncharacterized protein (DUF342 family)